MNGNMEMQYLNLLENVAQRGFKQETRNGTTFFLPGAMLQQDMADGFPLLTTKEVNFLSIFAELKGFIRGVDSAADFRRFGTKIWDANANRDGVGPTGAVVPNPWLKNPHRKGEDDLGRIYGVQWRNWQAYDLVPAIEGEQGVRYPKGAEYENRRIDQLRNALSGLNSNESSRRIIVSAWNPAELHKMALPPCHLLFQLLVQQDGDRLHMCMYQRSCDLFLGVPFNMASYALLLHLIARVAGYQPGILTMFLADVHVYDTHTVQVQEQLLRLARPLPTLKIDTGIPPVVVDQQLAWLEYITLDSVRVEGYVPHAAIKAPMSV